MTTAKCKQAKYAKDLQDGDQILWRYAGESRMEVVTNRTLHSDRHVSTHLESGQYLSLHYLEIINLA